MENDKILHSYTFKKYSKKNFKIYHDGLHDNFIKQFLEDEKFDGKSLFSIYFIVHYYTYFITKYMHIRVCAAFFQQ